MQFNPHETIFLIPSKVDGISPGFFKLGSITVDGAVETHTYRTYKMDGPVLTQLELEKALVNFKSEFNLPQTSLSEVIEFRAILCPHDYEMYSKPAHGVERVVVLG